MVDRWWDPDGPQVDLLEPGGDRQLDLANALVGMHRAGAAALLVAANTPLVDDITVKQALIDGRAAYAEPIVEAVSKSLGSETYAGLLVRDVADEAETSALRLYYTCVSKGVSPPIAVQRVAAVYGVPGPDLGKYAAMASAPVANQIALTDLADRALFGWTTRASAAELDEVAKAYDPTERRNPRGEWVKTADEISIDGQSVGDWVAQQAKGASVGPSEVATRGRRPTRARSVHSQHSKPRAVSDKPPGALVSTRAGKRAATRASTRASTRRAAVHSALAAKAGAPDRDQRALPLHDDQTYSVISPLDLYHRLGVEPNVATTQLLDEHSSNWLSGQEFYNDEEAVAEILTQTDLDMVEGQTLRTDTYTGDPAGLRLLQHRVAEALERSATVELQMRRVINSDGTMTVRATMIDHTDHPASPVLNVVRWGHTSTDTDYALHWGGQYRLLSDQQVGHWVAQSWDSTLKALPGIDETGHWIHNPKVDYWEIHDRPGDTYDDR